MKKPTNEHDHSHTLKILSYQLLEGTPIFQYLPYSRGKVISFCCIFIGNYR